MKRTTQVKGLSLAMRLDTLFYILELYMKDPTSAVIHLFFCHSAVLSTVCVYVRTHVRTCVDIRTYAYLHTYVLCSYTYVPTYVYLPMYVLCRYTYVRTYIYLPTYVLCRYTYVRTYVRISTDVCTV